MASFLDTLAAQVPQLRIALDAERKGALDQARAAYLELADQPQLTAIALHQLGALAERQGDPARAASLYQIALKLDPKRPIFHQSAAAALERLGRGAEALDALMGFAYALNAIGEMDAAIAVYRRILAADPNRYDAHLNIGTLLANREPRAGIPHLLRSVALCAWQQPRLGGFLAALLPRLVAEGLATRELGAVPALPRTETKLLEVGISNLGGALAQLGLQDEAIRCHRAAIELQPGFADAHFNLALMLLGGGAYAEGWREYEWRWRTTKWPEKRRYLAAAPWQGQNLEGKTILLQGEQGFGDMLQFAPLARRLGAARTVVLEVSEPVFALLRDSFAGDGIEVALRPKEAPPAAAERRVDYAIPLMSLPQQLGIGAGDLPLATDYLRAAPKATAQWRERLGKSGGLQVGIAWAGTALHPNDRNRSIALERLRPLFSVPGLAWTALQLAPQAAEPARLGLPVQDLSASIRDFSDTAAIVANLDLVIAVDTAVAHLAAGMGKPTWVLLPFFADWRWLRQRSDSPWYPSVRLFRQPRPGDWESVAVAVAAALAGFGR